MRLGAVASAGLLAVGLVVCGDASTSRGPEVGTFAMGLVSNS